MNPPPSQADKIADLLLQGKRITSLDVMMDEDIMCMRLSGRIYELRGRGLPIQREIVKVPSGKHVARYYIAAAARAEWKASRR